MRAIVLIPFFLLVLLGVGNGVPQIYTHFFRVPPVVGAPIVIPNAAAAAAAPTLYHHLHGRSAWRNDGRCGAKNNPNGVFEEHVAPNGHTAECNPHSSKPCCSAWGYCGQGVDSNGYDHCTCNSCTDYRPRTPAINWRPDGRCGNKVNPDGEHHEFILKNGKVAGCNPDSSDPCCSSYGWCGKGADSRGYSFCTCSNCEDYRKWPHSG